MLESFLLHVHPLLCVSFNYLKCKSSNLLLVFSNIDVEWYKVERTVFS